MTQTLTASPPEARRLPLRFLGGVLLALGLAIMAFVLLMRPPSEEIRAMALFLSITALVSVAAGYGGSFVLLEADPSHAKASQGNPSRCKTSHRHQGRNRNVERARAPALPALRRWAELLREFLGAVDDADLPALYASAVSVCGRSTCQTSLPSVARNNVSRLRRRNATS